jgi:acetolactate synthase small subunit
LKAAVFWDRKGTLMVEFMQRGIIITSNVYCKTAKKKTLHMTIQNKRRGILTPVEFSSMAMRVLIQLLVLKQCWSI